MIVLICGPPAVGKTTVARRLQRRLRERGQSVDMLDSDQYSLNAYDQMYAKIAGSSRDWIVAATFYKRQWQRAFETLDDVVVVRLTADLETCLERNRRRENRIEEDAVHIIWRELDEPDADLTIDTTDRSPGSVVDEILAEMDFSRATGGQ